jgi:DNA-directed RNA polymerase specialized sigma subunit
VWGRYRQEWSYYLHTVAESNARAEPIATPFVEANDKEDLDYFVGEALNQLSVEDQLLIHRLFWDNADQRRVAAKLQISQQCVSRRKTRVLRQLRRCLRGRSQLFSHILAACWTLFDSLDLLPIIDLL